MIHASTSRAPDEPVGKGVYCGLPRTSRSLFETEKRNRRGEAVDYAAAARPLGRRGGASPWWRMNGVATPPLASAGGSAQRSCALRTVNTWSAGAATC